MEGMSDRTPVIPLNRGDASTVTVSEASPHPDGEAEWPAGSMCSHCDRVMDRDSYISMDQPPMVCHQDCFTCAVCGCMLGDLQTPMFLCGQKIHCESCYFDINYSCGAGGRGADAGGVGGGVGGGGGGGSGGEGEEKEEGEEEEVEEEKGEEEDEEEGEEEEEEE